MLYRPRLHGQDNRPGIAATELAVLLPFLMFLWVITVDWARIFYFTITVQYAARDGCYYASDYPGIYGYSSVSEAALGESTNLTPSPTITTTYDTAYNGNYTSTTSTNQNYVQVKVTYTFNTLTNWPGVPSSTVLNRQVRMKIAPVVPN